MRIGEHLTGEGAVAVVGRRGVGVTAVCDGLAGAGVAVRETAEIAVLVIAEVLKPEDRATLAELRRGGTPVLIVLNKADLAGSGPGGPLATARGRAEQLRALTGSPVIPMVALLAGAVLTAQTAAALRVLAAEPADLSSPDAFLRAPHRVPVEMRVELLETLDRFGIAHAALALSRGAEAETLPGLLRSLSGIDQVLTALQAAAAPARYRRVRRAVAELRTLAAGPAGEHIGRFLAEDGTVIAVMAAAVDVVQADGVVVDPGTDAAAHLRRARRWQHYSRGPVNALHRSCGADIARGSLRLVTSAQRAVGR